MVREIGTTVAEADKGDIKAKLRNTAIKKLAEISVPGEDCG